MRIIAVHCIEDLLIELKKVFIKNDKYFILVIIYFNIFFKMFF